MPLQPPLELPEILSRIASCVPKRSRPTCARVSKGWYQSFIPLIWKDISLNTELEAMPRYRHHVKKLYVRIVNRMLDLPQCPNLQSLTLGEYPGSTDLILNHPHMTHLCIYQGKSLPDLWTILPQLHSLRDLYLSSTNVPEQETDTFWRLCTRLERLSVFYLSIPYQGQLSSMAFPGLKHLTIGFTKDIPTLLEFTSRCPNLEVLSWCLRPIKQDSYDVVERIAAKTWPHLHSVSFDREKIPQEKLISIMNSLQQMTCLQAECISFIQPDTMDRLRPHFASLTKLRLGPYQEPSTSRITQEILSSCPLLESFSFVHVDATAIAEGKPWVCTRLRSLAMHIQFDPLTISEIQPRVFEQIARLYLLGYLTLCGKFGGLLPFQTAVDLRLENGLGQLRTLRSLRAIRFGDSFQKMEEKEIEWMLEHWTLLEEIQGKCNRADPMMQAKLMKLVPGVMLEFSDWPIQ